MVARDMALGDGPVLVEVIPGGEKMAAGNLAEHGLHQRLSSRDDHPKYRAVKVGPPEHF